MKFRVLSVAFPFAPVGHDAVGGAEQVLAQLDAALVRAGHVFRRGRLRGLQPAGTLVPTPAHQIGRITDSVRGRVHASASWRDRARAPSLAD